MSTEKKVLCINDTEGKEIAMVRVDKKASDLINSCESKRMIWSRWDVKYYHKKYYEIMNEISNKFCLISLGKDLIYFKQGDIPRVSKGEKGKGIKINPDNRLLEGTSMYDTGLDYNQFQPVSDKFWQRMQSAKIQENDFIFTRTGASLGQSIVVTTTPSQTYLINGALDILRFKTLNPYYACVFMMSERYGRMQCERIENGVGQPNLNEDELCLFMITEIPDTIQSNIESEYKKMSAYHNKAMEAKAKGDEAEYKKNIATAEKMLKDLITRTEAVIRGEREDVV